VSKRSKRMPRYHFNLIDHVIVEDRGGQILADDLMAVRVADELARKVFEVRPELRNKGCSFLVTDATGRKVHRSPIEELAIRPPLSD
jgi:hypothetical protein